MGGASSQQGSQSEGKKKYQDDSLRPVTIKQLIECKESYPNSDMMLDGATLTQITFVGQVRSVNPQTTNTTYRLDDGTGVIDVKWWIDADKIDDDNDAANRQLTLDTYVRVWGRLMTFNGKKHVGAHCVRVVADFNEVNYHLLEATYVHLSLTRAAQPKQDDGDGMFVDGGYGAGAGAGAGGSGYSHEVSMRRARCSNKAQKVFDFLANFPNAGTDGVHANLVASSTGLSRVDVEAAGAELLEHGLTYVTLDDETWAVLEV
ncbi:replication protein A, subunit RPA32 [Trichocladium antarcticum]|uniref:Replication protein A, subunit RPA32 n=1 Tax=Trichocladium antarcticum TaxID=1450529 RepID=A0AAN6UJP1_9PEZI|nr:replication protein A, subunit RPA32 [Trichocladium antarcticum]